MFRRKPDAAGAAPDLSVIAVEAGSFKTLAAALGAAGLVDTLKGAGARALQVLRPKPAPFAWRAACRSKVYLLLQAATVIMRKVSARPGLMYAPMVPLYALGQLFVYPAPVQAARRGGTIHRSDAHRLTDLHRCRPVHRVCADRCCLRRPAGGHRR